MSRATSVLLAAVGLLAGVILGVTGTLLVQASADDEMVLEDFPGYDDAKTSAGYYCTLGGAVPGMTGLDDPAYLNCVERETRANLVEAGHPEAEHAEARTD
jgi:hypothetical protein